MMNWNLSGKDFLHISGLDLGFYVFVYTSLYLWTYLLQVKAAPLAAIDINSVALQKQSELAQTLSTMKGFLIFLAVLIIIFTLGGIIGTSYFKGMIYARMLKKKFNKKELIRFAKSNILWYLGCSAILLLLTFWARTKIYGPAVLFLIFLYMIFVTTIYQIVRINHTPNALKKIINLSTRKFPKFIIPLIWITAIFLITSFISRIFLYMPQIPAVILSAALYISFLTWARYYLFNIVKKLIY